MRKTKHTQLTASIMGIERLRENLDGPGFRTLVLFDSCPLQCRYCLNMAAMKSGIKRSFTPGELINTIMCDSPYYYVSNGGVTFGGGEPALQSDFIDAFYRLTNGEWGIVLETSLNIPLEHIKKLAPIVEQFYVDIKSMNPFLYESYTSCKGDLAYSNLQWLVDNGYSAKTIVRVPLIPDINTENEQAESVEMLEAMGLKTERFQYVQTREAFNALAGTPSLPDDLTGDITPEGWEAWKAQHRDDDDEREEEM